MSDAEQDLSRCPSDYYAPTLSHFGQRFRDREIPTVVLTKAIEGGEVFPEEGDDDNVLLRTEYLGYTFAVVVNPTDEALVTAYCEDEGWP